MKKSVDPQDTGKDGEQAEVQKPVTAESVRSRRSKRADWLVGSGPGYWQAVGSSRSAAKRAKRP